MAQLSKPPIPLKMYKHFAVATVSLTAGIAMFADSDNRQAVQSHVEQRTEHARLQQVSAQNTTSPQLVRRDQGRQATFGDEGGITGAPTVSSATSNSGFAGPAQAGRRVSVDGYDQSFINGLSEAEYRALLQTLPPEMRGDEDNASQRAAIEAASARRSGRRTTGTDAPE